MYIEQTPVFPLIRCEEEEEGDAPSMGFGAVLKSTDGTRAGAFNVFAEALQKIIEERQIILRDEKLSSKEKAHLLESTRAMLFTVRGGRLVKTDKIVYAI